MLVAGGWEAHRTFERCPLLPCGLSSLAQWLTLGAVVIRNENTFESILLHLFTAI